MTTYTRTHTYITFANPHLLCDTCQQPAPRWHNDDRCGCDDSFWNEPCGHRSGVSSSCPSWNPVDGCQCLETFGAVEHKHPQPAN